MRKIAISLSKGGVGKSSSAVSIAHGLSLRGKKTLLIDTDDQGQDAFLLGVKPELGLAEVLNEEAQASDAIFEARPRLWILSGGKALAGVKRAIGRKDFAAEQTLSEALRPLEGQFDFVVLDSAPSWDTLTINTLFYAQEVLTPVSLEVLSLNSLAEFSSRISAIQKHHPELRHRYLLPTFLDRRVAKSEELLEQLKKHYKDKVCNPIRYSVKISEAAGWGKTVFEFAPSSPGAKDYQKIVDRIVDND